MEWPTAPPTMPPPGWYADPERPWTWRYWDGTSWTPHVAPMQQPPRRDPYSFSAWFEESTAAVTSVIRRAGLVIVAVFLLVSIAFVGVFWAAYDSADGRELRDVVGLDEVFESDTTIVLSDAERDRAGELAGDLLTTWLPALIVLTVVAVVAWAWSVAMAAQITWREAGDDATSKGAPSAGALAATQASPMRRSFSRLPAVIGSYVALVAIIAAAMAVPLLPLLVAAAADAGAAAIGITATLGGITALVLVCLVGGRLSLALVLAARGGHGVGVRRSWELTGGHYWGVVGRILVAGIIASVASAPFSFLNGLGLAFGLWVAVVLIMLGQVLSNAATVFVTVPSQVVLARHLEGQHAAAGGQPAGW